MQKPLLNRLLTDGIMGLKTNEFFQALFSLLPK